MAAEDRQERAPLIPSGKEFAVGGVPWPFVILTVPEPLQTIFHKERANVHGPVRQAAGAKMKACCHLTAQRLPGGRNVARPQDRPEALLPKIPAPREIHDALFSLSQGFPSFFIRRLCCGLRLLPKLLVITSLPFINGLRMIEAVGVGLCCGKMQCRRFTILFICLCTFRPDKMVPLRRERLAVVAPPGIHAVDEQAPLRLRPIGLSALGLYGIIVVDPGKQKVLFPEFLVVFRPFREVRPDGDHEMHVPVMKLPCHGGRIRESFRVKGLLPPLSLRPGTPVEHDAVQANAAFSVPRCDL